MKGIVLELKKQHPPVECGSNQGPDGERDQLGQHSEEPSIKFDFQPSGEGIFVKFRVEYGAGDLSV